MKKIIFLANFMLVFSKVLGAPVNNFQNSSIDKVDICRMFNLTKDQTTQLLKSRKEKDTRTIDEKCQRFSQRMNEILINQTTKIRLDNVEESTSSLLEPSSADKCINEYFENLSQTQKTQSTIFSNNRITRINQNKISTKHKPSEKQEVPTLKHILTGIEKINADKKRKRATNSETSQSEQENLNIINYRSSKRRMIKTSDDLFMVTIKPIKNPKPTYQIPITTWLNKIRNNPEKEIIEELKQLKNTNKRNNININGKTVNTLLITAVKFGKSELAKYLIEEGAEVNAKDKNGNTALMIAFEKEYQDIADLLMQESKKWDVNALNEDGDSALIIAASRAKDKKDIANIKKLIKMQADINIQNKNGHTALIRSIIGGSIDVIKLLLENGASINIRNKNGNSELLKVLNAKENNDEIIKLLIDNLVGISNFKN